MNVYIEYGLEILFAIALFWITYKTLPLSRIIQS